MAIQHPQYGLASVEGFCQGWGELNQLADVASQILNAKYPEMGSVRVSNRLLAMVANFAHNQK